MNNSKIVVVLICLSMISISVFLVGLDNGREPLQKEDMGQDFETKAIDIWDSIPKLEGVSAKLFLEERYILIQYTPPECVLCREADGYDTIYIDETTQLLGPGKPVLPMKDIVLAIPNNAVVSTSELIQNDITMLDGKYNIKPDIPTTSNGKLLSDFTGPDPEIYNSISPYPGRVFEVQGRVMLRHMTGLRICFYPVQYKPALGLLVFSNEIRLKVYLESEDGTPFSHPSASSKDSIEMSNLLYLIANPWDVKIVPKDYGTRGGGDPKYVIVTSNSGTPSLEDKLQPLADWKTNYLNISTVIKAVEDIDIEYSGADLSEKIWKYLKDMYDTYAIEWVLLGGDETVVPVGRSNSAGNQYDLGYDHNYTEMVRIDQWDCIPELRLGRLSTASVGEMGTLVNNIINYQKDLRDWRRNGYLVGTNVWFEGDGCRAGEDVWKERGRWPEHGVTVYRDYENKSDAEDPGSVGEITTTRISSRLNAGVGASSWWGHGSVTGFYKSEGTVCVWDTGDVDSLTNAGMRPSILWAMACSTGNFRGATTSLAEKLLTVSNGGVNGYIGAIDEPDGTVALGMVDQFWDMYDKKYEYNMTWRKYYFKDEWDPYPSTKESFVGECDRLTRCHGGMGQNSEDLFHFLGDPQLSIFLNYPECLNDSSTTGIGTAPDFSDFAEKKGFDQGDTAVIKADVWYSSSALPEECTLNVTIKSTPDTGVKTYYLERVINSLTLEDPVEYFEWSIPGDAPTDKYYITTRIYNSSVGWETVQENITYMFIGWDAELTDIVQVNAEVVEGDTVTYSVTIDESGEEIPLPMNPTLWVEWEGRNYDPYLTSENFVGSNVTVIALGTHDYEVTVTFPEAGYWNYTTYLTVKGEVMDSIEVAGLTIVKGVRLLETTLNHLYFFTGDNVKLSYKCLVVSDFIGSAHLHVQSQTDQVVDPMNFENSSSFYINFTWQIPNIANTTYALELEVWGYARYLVDDSGSSMRVVNIREFLDPAVQWLKDSQRIDGGWGIYDPPFWTEGSTVEETAYAVTALLRAGEDPYSSVIQNAIDFINDTLDPQNLSNAQYLAQVIWSLEEAGRGSLSKVSECADTLAAIQNNLIILETWKVNVTSDLFLATPQNYELEVKGYDVNDGLVYGPITKGGTINNAPPPHVTEEFTVPAGVGIYWMNVTVHYDGGVGGGGTPLLMGMYDDDGQPMDDEYMVFEDPPWFCRFSEHVHFDGGWGNKEGFESNAFFTGYGCVGFNVAGTYADSKDMGIQWLKENQSFNGSWISEKTWASGIVSEFGKYHVEDTSMAIITLLMNDSAANVPLAVKWLEDQQLSGTAYGQDLTGSYLFSSVNWRDIYSLAKGTSYAVRALLKAGKTFYDNLSVRDGIRWLCENQKSNGSWGGVPNLGSRFSPYMVAAQAAIALAMADADFIFRQYLESGWNLVSVPLLQVNPSIEAVLASIDGKYDAVRWYDVKETNDPWKHYKVDKPFGNDLFELNETMGFWIHIIEPGGVIFEYSGVQPTTSQDIQLYKGWNLVGYPSSMVYNRTLGLNNTDFRFHINSIWSYNAATQNWENMQESDTFRPGRGYWFHAKSDIVWHVPL